MSFSASRWVSIGLLMSVEEWTQFFHDFPRVRLFRVASSVEKGKEEMEISEFKPHDKIYHRDRNHARS